jgi:hypothetical protein
MPGDVVEPEALLVLSPQAGQVFAATCSRAIFVTRSGADSNFLQS